MELRFRPRTLLTLFFVALFAYVVIEASDMPLKARLYPWSVGLIALALLAYQLIREMLTTSGSGLQETGVDIDFTEEEASREGKRRAFELFGWLYGFAVLLWLVGFHVAIPLMVLLYMLRHRETLAMTIALPVGAGAATWIIFDYFLHLPFPPGVLVEWTGPA